MATALVSGIECAILTNSTSNGPIVTRPPCGTSCSGTSFRQGVSASFSFSIAIGKRVA